MYRLYLSPSQQRGRNQQQSSAGCTSKWLRFHEEQTRRSLLTDRTDRQLRTTRNR